MVKILKAKHPKKEIFGIDKEILRETIAMAIALVILATILTYKSVNFL